MNDYFSRLIALTRSQWLSRSHEETSERDSLQEREEKREAMDDSLEPLIEEIETREEAEEPTLAQPAIERPRKTAEKPLIGEIETREEAEEPTLAQPAIERPRKTAEKPLIGEIKTREEAEEPTQEPSKIIFAPEWNQKVSAKSESLLRLIEDIGSVEESEEPTQPQSEIKESLREPEKPLMKPSETVTYRKLKEKTDPKDESLKYLIEHAEHVKEYNETSSREQKEKTGPKLEPLRLPIKEIETTEEPTEPAQIQSENDRMFAEDQKEGEDQRIREGRQARNAPRVLAEDGKSEEKQISLKEILEWIGHDSRKELQHAQLDSEKKRTPSQELPSLIESTLKLKPIEHQISIGTIKMTIEDPEREKPFSKIRSPKPRMINRIRPGSSSRLSRHYIRQ